MYFHEIFIDSPILSLSLLTDRDNDKYIHEGDRLQFRCMVEANPWITNTEWFANVIL